LLSLQINTNPVEVYKHWVNQTEAETGQTRSVLLSLQTNTNPVEVYKQWVNQTEAVTGQTRSVLLSLQINTNPVDVYKQWVNQTEAETGQTRSILAICSSVLLLLSTVEGKGKGRAFVIAPQVDTATSEALRYMARTTQCRRSLFLSLGSMSSRRSRLHE